MGAPVLAVAVVIPSKSVYDLSLGLFMMVQTITRELSWCGWMLMCLNIGEHISQTPEFIEALLLEKRHVDCYESCSSSCPNNSLQD